MKLPAEMTDEELSAEFDKDPASRHPDTIAELIIRDRKGPRVQMPAEEFIAYLRALDNKDEGQEGDNGNV